MIKENTRISPTLENNSRPLRIDWIILISISLILFLAHDYGDILITTRHGINFWITLFNGQIFNFYSYNLWAVSGNVFYDSFQLAMYDFPVYIVFAIWNFPLWVLETFFKIDVMNSVLCLIWSKSMLVVFLLLSAKIVEKICLELKMNENTAIWCVFAYLSSALVFSSLYVISQYDIIGLLFILIGFYEYLKENTVKFLFWFAIAVAFKFYALFIFIPLILLKEKRILHLIKYFIISISVTLLFKLMFIFDAATVVSGDLQFERIQMLVRKTLPLSFGTISFFFLLTTLLYIFCYFKKINSPDELREYSVYVAFLSLAIFFGSSYAFPYWIIIFVPFTLFLIFQNLDKIKTNFIIEIVMTAAFILGQMIEFSGCFGIKTIQTMVLPKIFGDISSLPVIFSTEAMMMPSNDPLTRDIILPIFLSVAVACLIALAVINFPKNNENQITGEIKIDRKLILGRMLIGAGICLLPIAGYFASIATKLFY